MRKPPDIIKNPQAIEEELRKAGVFVFPDGTRQWVGNMTPQTLYAVAGILLGQHDARLQEAEAFGWSILHTVNGSMAYEMIENELLAISEGDALAESLQEDPLWLAIKTEMTERGLSARWQHG
jgi:hypothetical protein